MTFLEKLNVGWRRSRFACVGLDPRGNLIPTQIHGLRATRVETFCRSIVQACNEYALAFKPNLAFFEAMGGVKG